MLFPRDYTGKRLGIVEALGEAEAFAGRMKTEPRFRITEHKQAESRHPYRKILPNAVIHAISSAIVLDIESLEASGRRHTAL